MGDMGKDLSVTGIKSTPICTPTKKSGGLKKVLTPISNYFAHYGEDVATVTAYVEDTSKDLVERVGDWFKKQYHSLFATTEATAKTISQAEQKEAKAKTAPEKAAAKKEGGQAAKSYLKEGVKSQAVKQAIDSMTDEQAVQYFKQLAASLSQAADQKNIDVYIAKKDELMVSLDTLEKRQVKNPIVLKVAEEAYKKDQELTPGVRALISENKDKVNNNTPSAEGLKIIKESAQQGEALFNLDVEGTKSAKNLGMSNQVILQAENNIKADRALIGEIIQVAEAKGYKLDNFAQLASIAGIISGEGAEVEVVATTDITQLNVLSKVKQALNNLFTDVSNMLRENREKNRKLDESYAKITREKKREELRQIERDFVKKLQDKKLQNKLHMEVIALSYLLQNPEEMTQELVGAIKDEVNKIKWQFIYSRAQ